MDLPTEIEKRLEKGIANEATRKQVRAEIVDLFNSEMVDFLRQIRAASELPPEEFKQHIIKCVESAEEILAEMQVEL